MKIIYFIIISIPFLMNCANSGIEYDCDLNNNLYFTNQEKTCVKIDSDVFVGGSLNLIGKDKSVYIIYKYDINELDNISEFLRYESKFQEFSNVTDYILQGESLVVRVNAQSGETTSSSILLNESEQNIIKFLNQIEDAWQKNRR